MKVGVRGVLGILLSAILLWWTLRDIHFSEVVTHLKSANLPLLMLSAIAATGIFPLRARRWRPILDPILPNIPFMMLWRPVAIGMMISNVVPARAGELARAYALTREEPRVPFSAAFASVAVDRVFDAVILLTLMFLAMLDPRFAATATIAGRPVTAVAYGGLAFALAAAGVLLALVFLPNLVLHVFSVVVGTISKKLESKARGWLEAFIGGLAVLRDGRRFLSVLWWGILHWLLNALAFWIGFKAVGIDAPFSAALFLQALIAIGIAVPQAPGFFGMFEALGRAGLAIYGVAQDQAVAWAIGFHFLSFIPITVIGAIYFARMGMHVGDINRAAKEGTAPVEDAPQPEATR
jgi:glycosyltransferase 2 family protein